MAPLSGQPQQLHWSIWEKKGDSFLTPTLPHTLLFLSHTHTYKNNITSVTLLNEKPHHTFFLYQNLTSITYNNQSGQQKQAMNTIQWHIIPCEVMRRPNYCMWHTHTYIYTYKVVNIKSVKIKRNRRSGMMIFRRIISMSDRFHWVALPFDTLLWLTRKPVTRGAFCRCHGLERVRK